jgi:hypothetical protein
MAKVTPISEHFQHFLAEMKEMFWGDLYGQTRQAWQRFFQPAAIRYCVIPLKRRDHDSPQAAAFC